MSKRGRVASLVRRVPSAVVDEARLAYAMQGTATLRLIIAESAKADRGHAEDHPLSEEGP